MSSEKPPDGPYRRGADGIYVAPGRVEHRDEEYDPAGFETLLAMQRRHFWYRGRHRLLLLALRRELARRPPAERPAGVDLGGGCGGWLAYLAERAGDLLGELALADSSRVALERAAPVVGPAVARYQVDLLDLGWEERWEVAFLLDVVEHLAQDARALRQAARALKPGGLLLLTVPALRFFWSYNDELVRHRRRYSRADLARLGIASGLELRSARYFFFATSPLFFAARWRRPPLESMSGEQIAACLRRTHRVPPAPVNLLLTWIVAAEAPLALRLPLPWGTSLLGVFRKPSGPTDR